MRNVNIRHHRPREQRQRPQGRSRRESREAGLFAAARKNLHQAHGLPDSTALPVLLCFAAAAMVPAPAWKRIFRRGPLEVVLYAATAPARLIT